MQSQQAALIAENKRKLQAQLIFTKSDALQMCKPGKLFTFWTRTFPLITRQSTKRYFRHEITLRLINYVAKHNIRPGGKV